MQKKLEINKANAEKWNEIFNQYFIKLNAWLGIDMIFKGVTSLYVLNWHKIDE